MHNMKQNYNHDCRYEIIIRHTVCGAWYWIRLFTPYRIIAGKVVEIYDKDKPKIKKEKEQQINDTIECFENLVQMSDKEICEWLTTNDMSRYRGYAWCYIHDHSDFYYKIKIGNYGLFDPN